LSYGKQLSEEEFTALLEAAGGTKEYRSGTRLPHPAIELNRVLREIRVRLGQCEFRANLLNSYGGKCVISECEVAETLEASHIDPWCNSESQNASNGLLLRADLHTLFDRDLIGIQPGTMTVHVAKSIRESEYGRFHGTDLNTPSGENALPNADTLERRWSAFIERHGAE
jgi:predicted restriction endonuclease